MVLQGAIVILKILCKISTKIFFDIEAHCPHKGFPLLGVELGGSTHLHFLGVVD